MTREQIEKLAKLEREASGMPWLVQGRDLDAIRTEGYQSEGRLYRLKHKSDVALIATMRNALPELLELARKGLEAQEEINQFLGTMVAINEHQGYPFTQVLMTARQRFNNIFEKASAQRGGG